MTDLPSWPAMTEEEHIAFFREHMAAGKTFGQMAALVAGASRNALIGRRKRLEARGIKLPVANPKSRNLVKPGRVAKARNPVVKPVKAVKPEPAARGVKTDPVPPSNVKGFQPIPGVTPIPIIDLPRRKRCRWPVDVPGERHFACGAATATDEHVYCAPHRRLSVRGAQHQGAL